MKCVRCSLYVQRGHGCILLRRVSWTHSWPTGFTRWFEPLTPTLSPQPQNCPLPQNETCSNCVFDLFLYKKGTIYITFIKSFSIIKYNITLLQKFQIPATIQDKLPIRVHTGSFFHFNSFFFFFLFKQRPVLHVPTILTRQD